MKLPLFFRTKDIQKRINSHAKQYLICVLLFALLFLGLILRFSVFDFGGQNFYHEDVARDYLIGSHVFLYGDLPLVGPDGYFGANTNSPFYYYLIAGLLFINNDILFPGFVNIFLQTLTILLVYLLGKQIFGIKTGIIAAALFALLDGAVAQSMQMWQPYLMQPVLLLSYLFLIKGYTQNKDAYVYISSGLLAFSAILHTSVLAIIPIHFGVLWYMRLKQKAPLLRMILPSIIFCVAFVLLYVPVGYYAWKIEPSQQSTSYGHLYELPQLSDPSTSEVFIQTGGRVINLFTYVFEGSLDGVTAYTTLCIFLFIAGSVAYVATQKDKKRRYFFIIILCALILNSFAVGSLKIIEQGFPIRYYTPVFVLFIILVSELIMQGEKKYPHIWIIKGVILITLMWVGTDYVRDSSVNFITRLHDDGVTVFSPEYVLPEDVIKLSVLIDRYTKEVGSFEFDIRTIEKDYEHLYKNEIAWASLEILLDRQLVHIDTKTFRGYAVKGEAEILFVRCLDTTVDTCSDVFHRKYKDFFTIEGVVYESSKVTYLYARKN